MRFNLIYDFHKNPDWKDFYFEYIELKKYLKNARKFFNKQVKYECKRHPSNTNLQHVRELELKTNKINKEGPVFNYLNNGENKKDSGNKEKINNHRTENNNYVTILKEVKMFESLEQFSRKYISKFKKKLKKVERFFINVRDDLKTDFEHLKHLVLTCEDIEVILFKIGISKSKCVGEFTKY